MMKSPVSALCWAGEQQSAQEWEGTARDRLMRQQDVVEVFWGTLNLGTLVAFDGADQRPTLVYRPAQLAGALVGGLKFVGTRRIDLFWNGLPIGG